MAGNKKIAMENLAKAWESPDIGKRGPAKATLDKEAARQIYLEKMSQQWETITQVHIEEAIKPENREERKEAIHQFIGKPTETMEVTQTTHLKIDI